MGGGIWYTPVLDNPTLLIADVSGWIRPTVLGDSPLRRRTSFFMIFHWVLPMFFIGLSNVILLGYPTMIFGCDPFYSILSFSQSATPFYWAIPISVHQSRTDPVWTPCPMLPQIQIGPLSKLRCKNHQFPASCGYEHIYIYINSSIGWSKPDQYGRICFFGPFWYQKGLGDHPGDG